MHDREGEGCDQNMFCQGGSIRRIDLVGKKSWYGQDKMAGKNREPER